MTESNALFRIRLKVTPSGIFRLRVLHKIDSKVILLHTLDKNCHRCEGPNNLFQKWQYRETAPTNTPTTAESGRGYRMNQRCTIETKTCFCVPTRVPVPKQLCND